MIDADRLGSRAARLAPVLATASLAACGFQLEGTGSLPEQMATTYLETSTPNTEFFGSLQSLLRERGLQIVDSPDDAGARLIISEDSTGQRVLSVSAQNTPREYEIYYAVTVSVQAGETRLMAPESRVLTRSYTYDETQVLGKSEEERILRQALADDLARQIVRRIESAGTTAPAGATTPAG